MDSPQAIAAFALAAIPGVPVLEILEYGEPRLRERQGLRAIAGYLIVSGIVWGLAVVIFGADAKLATVIDTAGSPGEAQVGAYLELAWRLVVTAAGLGLALRGARWIAAWAARKLEDQRRLGRASAGGPVGDLLIGVASIAFAWDGLMIRLRRQARAQIVHVRFRDGSDMYGVLAAEGRADFQAEGRGLTLDAELLEQADGTLVVVPGSSGVFVAPDAVASVSFSDYP